MARDKLVRGLLLGLRKNPPFGGAVKVVLGKIIRESVTIVHQVHLAFEKY